jgi:hypothetical protein
LGTKNSFMLRIEKKKASVQQTLHNYVLECCEVIVPHAKFTLNIPTL